MDHGAVTRSEVVAVTAVLLVLAAGVLGANFFIGETVAPMDLLADQPGWREAGIGVDRASPHRTDILDGLLPRWLFLKRAMRRGTLPTWNPVPGGGEPGWQLLFNGVLTPRFLVFILLRDAIGFGLGLVVQMVIAGLGTHLLARRWTGIPGAVLAAVTFMLCGFNTSWMMWPHAATSAWIPWLLWALARTMDRADGRRVAGLALVTSFLLFGGFPAVAAYALYLAAAFLGVRVIVQTRVAGPARDLVRPPVLAAAGLILGMLVAAVQILPSLEFLGHVDRAYRGPIGHTIDATSLFFKPLSSAAPDPETAGYAGVLGLALALVGAAPYARRRPVELRFGVPFWTGAVVASLMLALRFPRPVVDIVYHLPGLASNPNNRWLVVYGLAVAILAGLGLDRLVTGTRNHRSHAWRRWPAVAAVCLITIQGADLARVSRAQNAVVPAWTFFPETSVTRWLLDTVEPGQKVIAEGFGIGGTLSSYGLPEWFAHGFHSAAEKELLDGLVADAWISPTAAAPSLTGADLTAGGLFDLLSIRFFVTPCAVVRDVLAPDPRGRPDRSILLAPGLEITQRMTSEYEQLIEGVTVLMDRGHIPATGAISLELRSPAGDRLAVASSSTPQMRGIHYVDFLFSDRVPITPGEYEIVLRAEIKRGPPPSLWLRPGPISGLFLSGAAQPGSLACDFIAPLAFPDPGRWRLALSSGGMCVIENLLAGNGAAVVSADDRPPGVELLEYAPDHARYRARTATGGRLVRSARTYPGWRATVNGVSAPIVPYGEALQSVAVPAGESVIAWTYQPASLKAGCAISATALLGLACLWLAPLWQSRRSRS